MMELWCAFKWGGVFLCLLVIAACACRVGLMDPKHHQALWRWKYILMATFACGMALDLLHNEFVAWWLCLGILMCVLDITITMRSWHNGPPLEARL